MAHRCSKCAGCPQCGEVPGLPPPPPDAPGAPEGGAGPKPRFKVISKRITYNTVASNQDKIVVSVPAATAVDVFVRYRDDNGVLEDPFGGVEQWKLFAKTGQTSLQVGETKTTGQSTTGNVDGVMARCIYSVNQPAESFDLILNGASVAAGNVLYFDVTIIAWGTEPTGVGPLRLNALTHGANPPELPDTFTGLSVFGRDQSDGGDVWMSLSINQGGIQDPEANGPLEGFTNLNVLPVGQYRAVAPTLTNLQLLPFQIDASGYLRVTIAGGSLGPFPAASALADADPNPTTTRIGSNSLFFNGTTWDRGRSGFITAGTPTGWQNVLSSGVYNSSAPAPTNGQAITIQLDASANLKVAEQYAPAAEDNVNGVIATARLPVASATYAWSPIFTTALAKSLVIKATNGVIRSITARIDQAATTGDYYLQLWNLAAVPADTTAVTSGNSLMAPFKVQHVQGTDDYVSLDFADGVFGNAGLVLELSTTEFTATLVGTAWLSATAEFA